MMRVPRPLPPASGVPSQPAGTQARSCTACSGSNTRLIRKTLSHPGGATSAVVVCRDCAHFWEELTVPRLSGATA
jgi:hypothetical protein